MKGETLLNPIAGLGLGVVTGLLADSVYVALPPEHQHVIHHWMWGLGITTVGALFSSTFWAFFGVGLFLNDSPDFKTAYPQ